MVPVPRQETKSTVSPYYVPEEHYSNWRMEQLNNSNLSPIMRSKKDKLQMASKMVDKECKKFLIEMNE